MPPPPPMPMDVLPARRTNAIARRPSHMHTQHIDRGQASNRIVTARCTRRTSRKRTAKLEQARGSGPIRLDQCTSLPLGLCTILRLPFPKKAFSSSAEKLCRGTTRHFPSRGSVAAEHMP